MHRAAPLVFLLAVAVVCSSSSARAQCGAAVSECRTCHEVRGERSVLGTTAWHRDHAFGDFCAICHGGDPKAKDAAIAHVGVASPRANLEGSCGGCHGAETTTLAAKYFAAEDGGAPATAAPPAEVVIQIGMTTSPPSAPLPRPPVAWGNIALAVAILFAGAGGATFIAANERRLRAGVA